MIRFHSERRAGLLTASHQGSRAPSAQAEKVMASTMRADLVGQHGPAVQPAGNEVRRLEPAWILAPSNRPTFPTDMRAHTCARTYTRVHCEGLAIPATGKTKKEVRQVRRLDKPSIHAGSSRPTSLANNF